MSTKIRTQSSRTGLEARELETTGLDAGERAAAGGWPSCGRELSPELVDRAVDRARLRAAVELPDGGRLSDEVIDELLAGARSEEEIVGPGGLLAQLTKRLVERAMEVELTEHLGYEPHQEPPGGTGNTRNGSTPKTLVTDHGPVAIRTPRDRDASFEPKIVKKRQRRFVGFDEKILALYSRGLSTRDIEAHLQEIYGVKVGRELISKVTDAVMDDVRGWAKRPLEDVYPVDVRGWAKRSLEDVYPVVFLDALVLKIREGGSVQRRACYLALGVSVDGDRDVLGMWFQETEGAKFWMQILSDLKQRGVQDILIACVDGLKGFPEAIEAIFPKTTVRTCIVHLIRHSLRYSAAARARAGRPRPEADLQGGRRRRRPARARALRRAVGRTLPGDHPSLADGVGARNAVPRVPCRGPPRDLHNQRDRGVEPPAAQGDQDQRPLSQRGRRPQADLPRARQRRPAMDPNPKLDDRLAGVQDPLR
jgi:putative transposase